MQDLPQWEEVGSRRLQLRHLYRWEAFERCENRLQLVCQWEDLGKRRLQLFLLCRWEESRWQDELQHLPRWNLHGSEFHYLS
jgi:hypothetical protein